jgi:hypothetical protein
LSSQGNAQSSGNIHRSTIDGRARTHGHALFLQPEDIDGIGIDGNILRGGGKGDRQS